MSRATTKPVDAALQHIRLCAPEPMIDASLERYSLAIAELIAADVEYDAAHSAYSKAPSGKSRNDAWDRVLYAERRRADAIAAIQGENVGGGHG